MKNPHRSTDRAQTTEQTLPQRLAQQYSLKLPDDFTASSTVYGQGQAKAIGGDPVLSVTQNQLMEIVRRACHELTATPFSNSLVCPKQLSYGSPHIGLESDLQPPASGQQKSAASGRSTTVRHSTESPPARTCVRWRSPSHDNDEFFDARQSLSRSRSRTPTSRGRRPTSPSPPASRQPPNPSDDSDDDKGGKKPERRNNGRRQSPSPPPKRSGSTTGSKPWKK